MVEVAWETYLGLEIIFYRDVAYRGQEDERFAYDVRNSEGSDVMMGYGGFHTLLDAKEDAVYKIKARLRTLKK